MNSFEKFIRLYNIDSRSLTSKTEIGEGFLWYHCRATGEKAADIPMVLQYYKAAETELPTAKELEESFRKNKQGIIQAADPHRFRISLLTEPWFKEFEKPVFESGLPLFSINRTSSGVYLSSLPAPKKNIRFVFGRQKWYKVLHWANENPIAAWWLIFLLTLAGVLLAIFK